MRDFGLKLWSINKNYRTIAVELYNKNIYEFIELYAIPESFDDTISYWDNLNIPFIIHAPHFMQGVNFSIKDMYETNIKIIKDSFRFADKLNAKYIIFHPGIGGSYVETARQINLLNDSRILVENKPYNILREGAIAAENDFCVGAKYEEIKYILDSANVGFCLDIGHLFSASNALKLDKFKELKRFNELSPKLYHLSDGDIGGDIDKHLNISHGTYPIKDILALLNADIALTIETDKNSKENLDDFIEDVSILKKLQVDINRF